MPNYVRCAVQCCTNSSKKTGNKIQYYRFPKDEDFLTLWKIRCDRKGPWSTLKAYICSSHFTTEDFIEVSPGIFRLQPDAVPSKNLGFGWDVDDQNDVPMTVLDEDFTSEDDENDAIARALMNMRQGKLPYPSVSKDVKNSPTTRDIGSSSFSKPSTSTQSSISRVQPPKSSPAKKNRDPVVKVKKPSVPKNYEYIERKNSKYCCVPTCSAWQDSKRLAGFHGMPEDLALRQIWVQRIFHADLYCNKSRILCRRHFTTDDYLDKTTKSGKQKLRHNAVPSKNLPICREEAELARKKLALDLVHEDGNKVFIEQLSVNPQLQELYKSYMNVASQIDPTLTELLPRFRKRGELKGCGEPVPGDGVKPMALTIRKYTKKNTVNRVQPQLSENQKLKLFDQELESIGKAKNDSAELNKTQLEQPKLAPPAETFQIVATDPERGVKYKVIVKKVMKRKAVSNEHLVSKMAKNKEMEIVRNVLKDIDLSKVQPIQFPESEDVMASSKTLEAVEPTTLGGGISEDQSLGGRPDEPMDGDDDSLRDPFQDDNVGYEEIADGYDHSYTNRTASEVDVPFQPDPFEELKKKLMNSSEEEARELVSRTMDGYKDTFKKQMRRIRALLATKKTVDRKLQNVMRPLVCSLKEQYVKYYKD